jgi:acetylornithine deacetylase/succinyl-diaminopimelate desuccinylase-like protein
MTTLTSSALTEVFAAIDADADASIQDLRRLMRHASVTRDTEACTVCANDVVKIMRETGLQAEVSPAHHNPMVVGQTDQVPGRPTLLIAGHYDVVEPGPREAWTRDPFGAELVDGDILGRGAVDPKGNLLAGIKAAKAFLDVFGEVPINLKWLVDGDDEAHLGDLGAFVDTHKNRLSCDAVLLLDAGFTRDNNSPVHLGTAGSLGVDLHVRTGSKEPYFIWTQIVPDAAFRLTWALASLKDPAERVLIDGFYDDVVPPTAAELALMHDYPWRDDGELAFWGVEDFVTGARGVQALQRLLYEPTCSIHAIEPGLARAASDSLVPNEARARINFHLVPNQHPDDILKKLHAHLDRCGFQDVQVSVFRSFAPMAGAADSPLGRAIERAAAHVGVSTYLLPHSFEFGDKWCWLGSRLGVEGGMIGIGDPDRRAHFPNEHMTVPYYLNGIRWVAASYSVPRPHSADRRLRSKPRVERISLGRRVRQVESEPHGSKHTRHHLAHG